MYYSRFKMIFILLVSTMLLGACNQPSVKLDTFMKSPRTLINPFSDSVIANVSFLFVIDTSGSMDEINAHLANNFDHLLTLLQDFPYYNYNFALTTMSPKSTYGDNSPLFYLPPHQIRSSCQDKTNAITTMVKQLFHLGSYFEFNQQHFKQNEFLKLSCALSKNFTSIEGYDEGTESYFDAINYLIDEKDSVFHEKFFSRDNFLVIIFVSDAIGLFIEQQHDENQRSYTRVIDAGNQYGQTQIQKLYDIKKDRKIKAYGVLPTQSGGCGEGMQYPVRFPAHAYSFIEETKGKVFSVCEGNNWGTKLSIISEDLKESFTNQQFILNEIPLVETIEIYFNDYKIPNDTKKGWYYNPETLTIHISENFNIRNHMKNQKDNNYIIKYNPLNQSILYK